MALFSPIQHRLNRARIPQIVEPPPANPVLTEMGRRSDRDTVEWERVGNWLKPGLRVETPNGFVAVFGRYGQLEGPLVEIQDNRGNTVWEVEGTIEERQALFQKASANYNRRLAGRALEVRAEVERDILGD